MKAELLVAGLYYLTPYIRVLLMYASPDCTSYYRIDYNELSTEYTCELNCFCDLSIPPLHFICCCTGVAKSHPETQPPLYSRRPSPCLCMYTYNHQIARSIVTVSAEYSYKVRSISMPIWLNPSQQEVGM